jgi:glycosyltransferase involved in cell wall biosynthesis
VSKEFDDKNADAIGISVIVPVYNVEKYVERCIRSIIDQDFENFEVICVNDASTDSSREILTKLAKEDSRIKIIDNYVNLGLGQTRNIGMDHARGEYICFVDSDDFIAEDALGILYECAIRNRCMGIYFGTKVIYEDNPEKVVCSNVLDMPKIETIMTGAEVILKLYENRPISFVAWRQFYRRDYLEKIGIRFPIGVLYEDIWFTTYALVECDCVCYLKKDLYNYWRRPNSICYAGNRKNYLYGYVVAARLLTSYFEKCQSENQLSYKTAAARECYRMILALVQREYLYTNVEDMNDFIKRSSTQEKELLDKMLRLKQEGIICRELDKYDIDYIRNFPQIAIYGAGGIGVDIYCILKSKGICVSRFIVTNRNSNVDMIDSVPVQLVDEIKDEIRHDGSILVLVGGKGRMIQSIVKELKERNIENYYVCETLKTL